MKYNQLKKKKTLTLTSLIFTHQKQSLKWTTNEYYKCLIYF